MLLQSVLLVSTAIIANVIALQFEQQGSTTGAVPVELFVMSQCPDAISCESAFAEVFKQVTVPTTLDINYIAQPNPAEPLQFSCKHGAQECYGNMQQLCYKHVHGSETWLSFIQCMNTDRAAIGTDEWAKTCAEKHGKAYGQIADCLLDGTGIRLHAQSAARTSSLGITTSCTIYVDNKPRCVRDGNEWKNCPGGSSISDFVKTINDVRDSESTPATMPPLSDAKLQIQSPHGPQA
ncbi:hypothetical protein NQZ79_g7666 [Umbelopsis isabellina]|nr:hypothetical protein NQZ79_g7666 [Umbelopsis isabellina]